MDTQKYFEGLRIRILNWGKVLSSLEDDVERASEDFKVDYELRMAELMRDYEELQTRIDELEEADDKEEEKKMIDQEMEDFEAELELARKIIKDV